MQYDKRVEYSRGVLLESGVGPDPFEQFRAWFVEADACEEILEAGAMTLATASETGVPSARIVLLRNVDSGFVFFSNYDSRKGRELAANPQAALVFHWAPLERQVRVEGSVARVSESESDAYFASRPHVARLSALISKQSAVIDNATQLELELSELEKMYPPDSIVPRPEHWGGYRVSPSVVEFWQGRPSRLHDRLRYRLVDTEWVLERLSP